MTIPDQVAYSTAPVFTADTFVTALASLGWSADDFPNLTRSFETTLAAVENARRYLVENIGDDCLDVVAAGSLGRYELTEASDLDYLVVCHQDHEHGPAYFVREVDELREKLIPNVTLRPPGATGMFGVSIPQSELYEHIGLERDSVTTHSRRALVLEESVSLLRPQRHAALVRQMVIRYVDAIPPQPSRVPRFLINDLARYWHQLAVDYQAKSDNGVHSPIRRLKLIGPRKFTYAASVLALLNVERRALPKESMIEQLTVAFQTPPTLRFMSEVRYLIDSGVSDAGEQGFAAMKAIDTFNGLLSDESWRQRIERAKSREEADEMPDFTVAREQARVLQNELDKLFFSADLAELTRKYLVF